MTGNKSTYWCLCTDIYGETIGEPIDVKIDSSGTIETLKMEVWKNTPQFRPVSFGVLSNCLSVWKLSSFGRAKFAAGQNLISQANKEEVKSNDELLTMLFRSRSDPQDKYIHFLIQYQFGIESFNSPPLSEYILWCLRIDANGKIMGEPFKVQIESSKTISDLKEKVWDKTPEFKVISADRLVVWESNELSVDDFNREPPHILQSRISQAKRNKAQFSKELSTFFDKKSPQKELIYFMIEYPSEQAGDTFTPLHSPEKGHRYSNEITFKILESPTDLIWSEILTLNGFIMDENLPDNIRAILEKPRRMAQYHLQKGTQDRIGVLILDGSIRSQIINKLLSDRADASPYTEQNWELSFYEEVLRKIPIGAYTTPVSFIASNRVSPQQIVFNIFYPLENYWNSLIKEETTSCVYEKALPFSLIAEVKNKDSGETDLRKYSPKPDVVFYKSGFPFFLVEIDSESNSKDKHRLYAQLACVQRLACALLAESNNKGKVFFLMGVYASKEGALDRFFVFIDESGKIHFHWKNYLLCHQSEFIDFLFEFYNYSEYIKRNINIRDAEAVLKELKSDVDGGYDRSLYSKDLTSGGSKSKTRKSKTRKSKTRNGPKGGDASGGSNTTSVMTHALSQLGFRIFSLKEKEFKLMTELPDHIVRAESADGTSVVAKLVRKDSQLKELHILQMFSRMKSTLNHTIPLLDTIPSSLGSLLIIPYKTTLSEGAMFYESFRRISTRLSQELIEGVAFLHRHKVAHLDIKPNNIVYSLESKRLYIIDFNLSMRCKDIEEMVTNSCGTVGWSAPEVELDGNKPPRAFSPIRADLWSCGKVLQFILEKSGETKGSFSKVIDKLMDDEPKRRPLLHEIVDDKADFWVSNRLLEGVEKQVQVQCNAHRVMTIHGHKGLKRSRNIADFDKEVNLGSPSPDSVDDSNSSESGSSSGLNTPTLSTTTTTPPHILDQSLSDQLSTKIRNKLLILNNVLNTEEQ